MLYGIRYARNGLNRSEETDLQRALASKLLRYAVREEYQLDITEEPVWRGEHGKPYFTSLPVFFSLSHCKGFVCCAVSLQEVGVDAETVGNYLPKLCQRVCAPEEILEIETSSDPALSFITFWTLKESLMKYTGKGFSYGFQEARFSRIDGMSRCLCEPVQVNSFFPDDKLVISVCSAGEVFAPPVLLSNL